MAAFVYVMEADNGEVKVGFSGTPYARLSQVKRDYALRRRFSRVRLVGLVSTPAPLEVESLAHESLASHVCPTGGEWFTVDPLVAMVEILRAAIEYDRSAHVMWPTRKAATARPRLAGAT